MKKIRIELGFTQQDMALLLNISRSAVSMYEKGLRHLPGKASAKWAVLQLLWEENNQKKILPRHAEKSLLKTQQHHSLSLLHMQVQRAAERAISITQQVSRMEAQHSRLVKKIHFIKGLMQEAKPGSREMELLENREQRTLIGLAACGPERRQLLAYKLQVLHSQQKAALAGKVILQQQQ